MWTVMMASHPHGVVLRDNERWCMGGTWMPGLACDARRSAAGSLFCESSNMKMLFATKTNCLVRSSVKTKY
jgi:hypothetical protein